MVKNKLCVYGDIMLDEWIYGEVKRISPEAPIPVILESHRLYNLGGAANLAANLSSLNNKVNLYGVLSYDENGSKVIRQLNDLEINSTISHHSTTTLKTRIVDSSGHHIVRLDKEDMYIGNDIQNKLLDDLNQDDVLVISDYNKGLVDRNLISNALKKTKNILVDPKQSPDIYKDVYLIKPNMKQYKQWFGSFNQSVFSIMKEYNWKWLIITDSSNGIFVVNNGNIIHIKEEVKEIYDVTGAGDVVLAVIAHCFDKNMSIIKACENACYAASRSVERQGVHYITIDDLKKKVIFTNGVFDILHYGHLTLLKEAKSKGDKLIVGINSDASVKRLKGDSRPVNNERIRKKQLELLPYVDEVIIFDDDTPYNLIKELSPDLIVKGSDYSAEEVIGNDLASVCIIPIVPNQSTSNIIKRCAQWKY